MLHTLDLQGICQASFWASVSIQDEIFQNNDSKYIGDFRREKEKKKKFFFFILHIPMRVTNATQSPSFTYMEIFFISLFRFLSSSKWIEIYLSYRFGDSLSCNSRNILKHVLYLTSSTFHSLPHHYTYERHFCKLFLICYFHEL